MKMKCKTNKRSLKIEYLGVHLILHWSSRLGVGSMCQHPITREKKTHMLKYLDKGLKKWTAYIIIIFDTSETDDKEKRSRVIQARKCITCLNGILWSKDIRKERKLNIYNVLIKSSLLYGSETWRLSENNKRWVEATEMDALRRSARISRKERIRNVTIRQQIGLEEPIVKEIELNQLTE